MTTVCAHAKAKRYHECYDYAMIMQPTMDLPWHSFILSYEFSMTVVLLLSSQRLTGMVSTMSTVSPVLGPKEAVHE